MEDFCAIISGGAFSPLENIEKAAFVIACDQGLAYAQRCKVKPDLLVGDFDSYQGKIPDGVPRLELPAEKDDTDTMAAVRCAVDEGWRYSINAPLQNLSKAQIIRRGTALGVDYGLTTSCYNPDAEGRSCGKCASCALRIAGFREAGVPDPTRYTTD